LLPFGASIQTVQFSHYTVQAADFTLPNNRLTDTATVAWNNTCVADPDLDCTTLPQTASAGASALVAQLPSSTTTAIHNAAHQVVTAVGTGTTVHDFVTVTSPGNPPPSGNVTIDWFLNGTCTGAPAATSSPLPLAAGGTLDATGFAFIVNTAGSRAFRAHYLGDGTYTASDGPCEPLQVVDANIQISPLTATNAVGTTHTLTGHVNVNDGTGFANAPAGTVINFAILSGPGSFVGGVNQCTTSDASGSCTVQITSAVAGVTMVRASTTVAVAGVSLHRETGDGLPGDSADASKAWVDAFISIAPATDTNATGTNHVLTITVTAVGGTLASGTATASIVSGPGSFVGSPTCSYTGGAATASCTVTITSAVAGTTVISATSSIGVNGQTIVRTTGTAANTAAGGSDNASKTWQGGGEGCTPGYWKVPQHWDSWVGTGFSPNQTLASAGFTNTGTPTTTLVEALAGGGGSTIQGAKTILLRAAVAALLNSASPGVDFELSTAQVLSMVNAALATNDRDTILALAADLDAANNAGCPLN